MERFQVCQPMYCWFPVIVNVRQLAIMRTLSLLMILATIAAAGADEPRDRVVIHLLDPRGAIAGEQTMPIEWGNGKADVIATRLLSSRLSILSDHCHFLPGIGDLL